MCIKIVRLKETDEYDVTKPLEEQLRGSKQVVVNYDPTDPTIDKFLSELERLCKNGISAHLNLKFNNNNSLVGARVQRHMEKIVKDIDFNEIIKMMVCTQQQAEKKLEEMLELCRAK